MVKGSLPSQLFASRTAWACAARAGIKGTDTGVLLKGQQADSAPGLEAAIQGVPLYPESSSQACENWCLLEYFLVGYLRILVCLSLGGGARFLHGWL